MPRHLRSSGGTVAVVLLSSVLGACATSSGGGGAPSAAITAAVADSGRPDADKQRDANRKPAESVAFAGIKTGDKVVDLLPGGGYFTRVFSKTVGDTGVVYAVPPGPRPGAPAPTGPSPIETIASTYSNVRVVSTPLNTLALPEKADVIWTSLNYHDIHNQPNDAYVAFNKAVFNALKPGGTFIVIDHAAAPGAGATVTSTFHRIDPETVKQEVTAAGFKLVASGDFLRNPDDSHTAPVRDDTVRGHTDQFILKFVKPK